MSIAKTSISDRGGVPVLTIKQQPIIKPVRRVETTVDFSRIVVMSFNGIDGFQHLRVRVMLQSLTRHDITISCKGRNLTRLINWIAVQSCSPKYNLPQEIVSGIAECCNSL